MSTDTDIANGIRFLLTRGFTHHAPGDNAIILDALQGVPEAAPVSQHVSSVLIDQMSLSWLKSAALEDICRVATALHYYDEGCVTGHHLAIIVQRLLTSEAAPGGPYYNDSGVTTVTTNAAVAVFVNWAADTLPNVTEYISEHFVEKDNSWVTYRDLIRCSLAQSGDIRPPHAISEALNEQQTDGSWQLPGVSREVATAIMIHACSSRKQPNSDGTTYDSATATIFSLAQSLFDEQGPIIAGQAHSMIKKIEKANSHHEITLLSTFFGQSLPGKKIPESLYQQLGAANVLCWLAYMAYDHIMDGDADAALLPLANIAQRASLKMYVDACLDEQIARKVESIFDRMDKANAWELTTTRIDPQDRLEHVTLPVYTDLDQLAERSLGHIVGPLILAHRYLGASAVEEIEHGLVRYLVARQLNDDVHDWKEDAQAGMLTYVVSCLLFSLPHSLRLEQNIPDMQQRFWDQTGQIISAVTVDYIAQSKQILEACHIQISPDLRKLLDNIADSARRAIILREDSGSFLRHYSE